MSLNGYSYAHGNPVMNTDPSGALINVHPKLDPISLAEYVRRLAFGPGGVVQSVLIGAAFGVGFAGAYYVAARSNFCGCAEKRWAENLGGTHALKYVLKHAGIGAAFGAAMALGQGAAGLLVSRLGGYAMAAVLYVRQLLKGVSNLAFVISSIKALSSRKGICQIAASVAAGALIRFIPALNLYGVGKPLPSQLPPNTSTPALPPGRNITPSLGSGRAIIPIPPAPIVPVVPGVPPITSPPEGGLPEYLYSPDILYSAAREFGLSPDESQTFARGEWAVYNPNQNFFSVLKVEQNLVRSGIVYIRSSTGSGANIFSNWRQKSRNLAREIGVSNLELFGVATVNQELENMLRRLGFQDSQLTIPENVDFVGGETVDILTRIFSIR